MGTGVGEGFELIPGDAALGPDDHNHVSRVGQRDVGEPSYGRFVEHQGHTATIHRRADSRDDIGGRRKRTHIGDVRTT